MEAGHEIAGPAADIVQAAQCALAFLQDYRGPERDQIPFQILKALAETTDKLLHDGVPLENVQLDARELTEITLKAAHVRGPAAGKESVWISKHWRKLERLLDETRESQEEVARREGVGFIPALRKDQSKGGANLRSYYRFEARPLSVRSPVKEFAVPAGGLRYQAERRKRIPWLGRLYIGAPVGRVRVAVLIALIVLFVLSALVVLLPVILRPLMGADVRLSQSLIALLSIGGLSYLVLGPFFRVVAWKVIKAPILFHPSGEVEPLLLEKIGNPGGEATPRRIDLVKYTAECPICGGRVVVGSGGFRFWGRLVGRCRNSPREHVFSFDHVTRVGAPL